MRVGREVRRHPIQDDANPLLVEVVHQVHEILRRAVARSRREISRGLVAPRTVKRMLHDRHQFHVGEVHLLDVVCQAQRGFTIGQRTIAFLRNPHPGTEVNFVNRNRRLQRISLGARFHPLLDQPIRIPDPRRQMPFVAVSRAGFQTDPLSLQRGLGCAKRCDTCTKCPCRLRAINPSQMPELPRACNGWDFGIPTVEAANHRNFTGIRRPHREGRSRLSIDGGEVSAQLVVNPVVGAFIE